MDFIPVLLMSIQDLKARGAHLPRPCSELPWNSVNSVCGIYVVFGSHCGIKTSCKDRVLSLVSALVVCQDKISRQLQACSLSLSFFFLLGS